MTAGLKEQKKILVVDDTPENIHVLAGILEDQYDVLIAASGEKALKIVSMVPDIDMILLDIMMPELNGFDVCRELKHNNSTSKIPVIFLTAKENEIDEIIGLELGADDYIQKPISPRKVIARIKSVIRRTYAEAEKVIEREEYIKFKNLELDSSAHIVKVSNEEVFFPKKEFRLLHFLLANRGKVLSREILLNEIWGENIFVVDRTIDVHIAKVREKLGEYASYIETIKGLGYRFNND